MSKKKGHYAYGFNDEAFYGRYDTKKEAVRAAMEDESYDGQKDIYIALMEPLDATYSIDAEDVIRSIENELNDEHSDGYSLDVTADEMKDLQKRLDDAVDGWIKDNGIGGDILTAVRTDKYNAHEENVKK